MHKGPNGDKATSLGKIYIGNILEKEGNSRGKDLKIKSRREALPRQTSR